MINAVLMFRRNRSRIFDLKTAYNLLKGQSSLPQNQLDEILRAQFVQIVSSFDTFIHDCVRIGIVRQFINAVDSSNSLKSFPIPYEDFYIINNLSNINEKALYLNGVIKKINSKDSYQAPTSVEYALGLIGIDKIWTKVAPGMGMSANDVKQELAIIVNRRNKIVHESDLNVVGVSLNPISPCDIDRVLSFVYGLVIQIFHILRADCISGK